MKQIWYRIVQWVEYNLTLSKLKVVKHALTDPPYDWVYLLKMEQVKLREMYNYFSKSNITDQANTLKWISICIKLLDIMIENPEAYPYVNTQNLWRFIRPTDYVKGAMKEEVEHYYKSYPQELRWVKAEHLYYEIRKRYTCTWWD